MANNSFGDRLKKVRKDLGLTQLEMSERLEIAVQTYNRYEKGHRVPDIEFVGRVVKVSGCDAAWLLSGEGGAAQEVKESYDPALMSEVIEGLEEFLEQEGLTLAPKKKAQVIEYLYQEMTEDRGDVEKLKGKILKFTKLAS